MKSDYEKEMTLDAIRGSIQKWSLIVHLNGVDKGIQNCPLCEIFNEIDKDGYSGCPQCPVHTYTGDHFCESTPYQAWYDHCQEVHKDYDYDNHHTIRCPECRTLAQKELMFLQEVLEWYKEKK